MRNGTGAKPPAFISIPSARALAWLALLLVGIAPARGQEGAVGTIEGVVIDSKTGDPIIEAGVEVIDQNKKVKTDLDGKYSVKLPPGMYELRIFAPLYQGTRLKSVIVTPDKITRADANLKPEGEAGVETVEVVAEAKKSAETTQILQRQRAAVVSDTISAQQIVKSPDTKASEIVRRVPAVTIKDNKFIVVRGLGERYSSALLNGSRLPSTDPNKRVIPLDLFPADFIDSLNIIKTYTPDLPGDFAGGLLDIQLREYPTRFTYSIGVQTSVNTATTFQSFDTYHSSCPVDDYFGFGSNCRDLPGIFGNSQIPKNLTTAQQQQLVGSLPVNWNINRMTAPPNFSLTGSVGDSWGPFGINLAAIYKTQYLVRRDEAFNSYESGSPVTGQPQASQIFTYNQSDFETQLGAILTTGYQLSPNHKFFGNALVNRRSDDQVLDGEGKTFSFDFPNFTTSQLYTADQLGFGQIGGRDHWDALDADWRAAWAPSSEDQPDGKFLVYQQPDAPAPPHITDFSPSTDRTFATLNEFLQDYNADITVPFKTRLPFTDVWSGLAAKFKTGAAYTYRHRTFNYRIFATTINSANEGSIDLTLPPDQILIPPNYGEPTQGFPLSFQEVPQNNNFDASQTIAGGYGMFDLPLVQDRLRFVGGVRLEYSYIASNGTSLLGPADARINNLDPLPGVNFIYTPRPDMNVRYSVSETVSRPEFRELTPTQFIVATGQRTFQGNSNLVESHIISNDLRWEWFFTPLELASASFFYKNLDKPIEIVALSSTSQNIDTPVNANSGTLWGFEFELRKNFGFLTPYAARQNWLQWMAPELNNVQLLSNISIIESNVTGLGKLPNGSSCQGSQCLITNTSRPLQGQAKYVVNTALEYENATWGVWRLLYNTVGSYIVAAGVDHLPDIEQQPRNQLDAVWITQFAPFGTPLTGRFAVENILNDRYLQTQGDLVTNRYLGGVKFTFGVSYTY
jgi:hypothetical protein